MATGLYRYTTDKGRYYKLRLDKAVGDNPVFGFDTIDIENCDFLPRRMKPRNVGCHYKKPDFGIDPHPNSTYRSFPVGKANASILESTTPFTYKGVQYTPSRYRPEKSRK